MACYTMPILMLTPAVAAPLSEIHEEAACAVSPGLENAMEMSSGP